MHKGKELDQFFTKPDVAESCWRSLYPVLKKVIGKSPNDLFFIEPSVGSGAFYDFLPAGNMHRVGADIDPRRQEFVGHNFLTWKYRSFYYPRKQVVVIGNPPFGKRGDLAIQFFNKASELADTIAFILPVIFRKYFIHKQLAKDFRWVHSESLPREAFVMNGKPYEVNTEFQVWTRHNSSHPNKRLFTPQPIQHEDFDMWQYNNTKEALKVFKNDFAFAVPSQGWQDYNRREEDVKKCEKHKQWMLFKPKDDEVHHRLYTKINYEELALKNTTSIPGFRKGDIVQEYRCRYE